MVSSRYASAVNWLSEETLITALPTADPETLPRNTALVVKIDDVADSRYESAPKDPLIVDARTELALMVLSTEAFMIASDENELLNVPEIMALADQLPVSALAIIAFA